MTTRSFVVTVETDHDDEYLDYFAKHLADRLAGSVFSVTDVEPVNALNTQYRAGWRAAIKSIASGNAVDV